VKGWAAPAAATFPGQMLERLSRTQALQKQSARTAAGEFQRSRFLSEGASLKITQSRARQQTLEPHG
jgi:hypothetical protein